MPRVSEAHLAARRQQILDAARTCFIRNGFHATSMQDVIAEAGLSVGAVYRYFKSKDDLVDAIADTYAGEMATTIESLTADPDRSLVDVMSAAIAFMDTNVGPDGPMRLAVQVWGETVRNERAAAIAKKLYVRLRSKFVRVAERAVGTGELPAGTDPEATGATLFSLIVGFALQKMLTGGPEMERYQAGVRTLLDIPALSTPPGPPSAGNRAG